MTTVYVNLPLEWSYSRRVVHGMREYSRQRPDWRMIWVADLSTLGLIPAGQANKAGIVAMIRTPAILRSVLACGVPAVNVSGRMRDSPVPQVVPDSRAIGRLAAEHLLDRGYRNFVFVGDTSDDFSRIRFGGFFSAVKAKGYECVHVTPSGIRKHLRRVRRPVGIMLVLDDIGTEVMSACREAGLEIPREAALVGVNNDDVFCELAEVPLSSVDPDAARVGYEAAGLLDRLMAGGKRPSKPRVIPPRCVVTRESSDYFAMEDTDLAEAVHFISGHACDPITVKSIMGHVGICRRALEYRFRSHFGRTLHEEIRRVQLERAKRLLAETVLPIPEVARQSGFCYANRFSVIFRKAAGASPSEFRRRFRLA